MGYLRKDSRWVRRGLYGVPDGYESVFGIWWGSYKSFPIGFREFQETEGSPESGRLQWICQRHFRVIHASSRGLGFQGTQGRSRGLSEAFSEALKRISVTFEGVLGSLRGCLGVFQGVTESLWGDWRHFRGTAEGGLQKHLGTFRAVSSSDHQENFTNDFRWNLTMISKRKISQQTMLEILNST